jgi:general secretion pathway protein J
VEQRAMNRQQAGFTLIEVMIAITVMALLSVICWRALDSVASSDQHLRENDAETTASLRVLQQLQRDIEMRAEVYTPGDLLVPADEPQRLLPTSLVTAREPGGSFSLEITRSIGSEGTQWQRVRWYQQGRELRRAVGAPSSTFPLPAPVIAGALTVARDVQKFDVQAWQPGKGWRVLPVQGEGLPAQGLQVTVQQRDARGPMVFTRVLGL